MNRDLEMKEEMIWDKINESCGRMNEQQSWLWDMIRIDPIKWSQYPHGDVVSGFWVVAIFGNYVIYYNEIENGFNISKYSKIGRINNYWCNQDDLVEAVQRVIGKLQFGYEFDGNMTLE